MSKFREEEIVLTGSKEKLDNAAIFLETLGYAWKYGAAAEEYKGSYINLSVDYYSANGSLGYAIRSSSRYKKVPVEKELLWKTLLSMRTHGPFMPGEMLIYDVTSFGRHKSGYILVKEFENQGGADEKVYYTTRQSFDGMVKVDNSYLNHVDWIKSLRRATQEEIFKYLDGKTTEMSTEKVVGYKVKEGVDPTAAAKAIGYSSLPTHANGTNFYTNSIMEECARTLGVLDFLFEPVSKKELNVTFKGYKAEVKDGEIKFGCQTINKNTLEVLKDLYNRSELTFSATIGSTALDVRQINAMLEALN